MISYYNEREKLEIMQAAKKRGTSVSSFVSSAALADERENDESASMRTPQRGLRPTISLWA